MLSCTQLQNVDALILEKEKPWIHAVVPVPPRSRVGFRRTFTSLLGMHRCLVDDDMIGDAEILSKLYPPKRQWRLLCWMVSLIRVVAWLAVTLVSMFNRRPRQAQDQESERSSTMNKDNKSAKPLQTSTPIRPAESDTRSVVAETVPMHQPRSFDLTHRVVFEWHPCVPGFVEAARSRIALLFCSTEHSLHNQSQQQWRTRVVDSAVNTQSLYEGPPLSLSRQRLKQQPSAKPPFPPYDNPLVIIGDQEDDDRISLPASFILCVAFRPTRVALSIGLGTTSGLEIWNVSTKHHMTCYGDENAPQPPPKTIKEVIDLSSHGLNPNVAVEALAWSHQGRELLISRSDNLLLVLTQMYDPAWQQDIWVVKRVFNLDSSLTTRVRPKKLRSHFSKAFGGPVESVRGILALAWCLICPYVAAVSRGGDVVVIETVTWRRQAYTLHVDRASEVLPRIQWFPSATSVPSFLVATSRQLVEFQFPKTSSLTQQYAGGKNDFPSAPITTVIEITIPEDTFSKINWQDDETALVDLQDFSIEKTRGTRLAIVFEQSNAVFVYRYLTRLPPNKSATILEHIITPPSAFATNFQPCALSFSTFDSPHVTRQSIIESRVVSEWNKEIEGTISKLRQHRRDNADGSEQGDVVKSVSLAVNYVSNVPRFRTTTVIYELDISSTGHSKAERKRQEDTSVG